MNASPRILRIAFHRMGGKSWSFGPIYLKTLFRAVRSAKANVEFHLLVSSDQTDAGDYARAVEADGTIQYERPRRWSSEWLVNVAVRRWGSRDRVLEASLQRHDVDALFSMHLATRYSALATIGWIPDFQHLHLADMFSVQERESRDLGIMQMAQSADRIILLSQAVKADLEKFAPQCASKAQVLRPVTLLPTSIFANESAALWKEYHLPSKFVYLPNQFWKHKNHELVVDALAHLKERGTRITVICSGETSDNRNRDHFPDLQRKVARCGLHDQFRYIGCLSHEHVLGLMRQSICVLNPSLFEGWGAAVDEAKLLGKRVLLSDIPPHREQNPPGAVFFNPRDAADLALKLNDIWATEKPGPNREMEERSQRELPSRLHTYGESFISIVQDAIQSRGKSK